ncbi:uncharacterized protein LOC143023736 [Oratosquilla oratoria]|uniref:uncharacterized protein LOC143023736 n=1 Tax=Oratosquilla oratoria TaxID=337810 RepID=UPI003F76ED6C
MDNNNNLMQLMKEVSDMNVKYKVLLGDFNLPHIKWSNYTSEGGPTDFNTLFIEKVRDFFLTQHIHDVTRIRGENIGNTLDLMFTNEEIVEEVKVDSPLGKSDHACIYVRVNVQELEDSNIKHVFMYEKADYAMMKRKLDIDWQQFFGHRGYMEKKLDVETEYRRLNNQLRKETRNAVKAKEKEVIKNVKKNPKVFWKYVASKTKVKSRIGDLYQDAEKTRMATTNKENADTLSEQFASVFIEEPEEESPLASPRAVPRLYCKKNLEDQITDWTPSNRPRNYNRRPPRNLPWQMLAHQYNSVFSIPKRQAEIHDPATFFNEETINQNQLTDLQATLEDTIKAIKELMINSAAGPDGIPAILLLKCSEVLAVPIHMLWQSSLDKGKIPALVKQAIISPIYKGGDRTLPKIYRPVALTFHIIKVIEKCLRDKLFAYLEENNLIKESQHGFRKDRSCLSNLLTHYDWLLRNLSEGKNVDVVFLDFAKAFDKVDHGVLLHKAMDLGITGKLGIWLHNFLTDRTQTVAVDGQKSSEVKVMTTPHHGDRERGTGDGQLANSGLHMNKERSRGLRLPKEITPGILEG